MLLYQCWIGNYHLNYSLANIFPAITIALTKHLPYVLPRRVAFRLQLKAKDWLARSKICQMKKKMKKMKEIIFVETSDSIITDTSAYSFWRVVTAYGKYTRTNIWHAALRWIFERILNSVWRTIASLLIISNFNSLMVNAQILYPKLLILFYCVCYSNRCQHQTRQNLKGNIT